MNPPFVAWPDLDSKQRERVTTILGSAARVRPDMSTAFLSLAAQSVSPKGALGCVMPASFFDGESFRQVREQIGEVLQPHLIARLGSHELFHAARVDAGLYVGAKTRSNEPPIALWSDHKPSSVSEALRTLRRVRLLRSESDPVVKDSYSIYQHEAIGKNDVSWAPRPYTEWRLLQLVRHLPTVHDLFQVRQGTITGYNRALLLSQPEYDALPQAEQSFFRPAVVNESIVGGRIVVGTYVFYPYDRPSIASDADLRKVVPEYFRSHLEPNKQALLDRKRIKPDRWWELSEHRAWQVRPAPKLITTYFGDTGSFAWDRSGKFVVVQGYGWTPRGKRFTRKVFLAYVALLNSPIFRDLLAASSNHVGGGQWNLSKRYVRNIPIPNLVESGIDVLEGLATIGESVDKLGIGGLSEAQRSSLAELAWVSYRVTGQ